MQFSFDQESIQLINETMQAESVMRAAVAFEDELITGHEEDLA